MANGETREEGERPRGKEVGAPARRGGSRRIGGFLLLLLAICCAAGVADGVHLGQRNAQEESPQGLVYEVSVVSGDIPDKSREEHRREMDSLMGEGMLAILINVVPSGKVSGRDREINWLIENPSNQGKLIHVETTRDGAGERIYEAGAIRPRNCVESAPLDVELPTGTYERTAVFLVYGEKMEAFIE